MGDDLKKVLPEILHDLQSPMTVLQGFLRLLEDHPALSVLTKDQKELYEAAKVSLEKVKKILATLSANCR